MAFTVPLHPNPREGLLQGPLEPVDIGENSPFSLYILCAKFIVQNIKQIRLKGQCKLPAEVCDNLIEVTLLLLSAFRSPPQSSLSLSLSLSLIARYSAKMANCAVRSSTG